MAKKAASKRHRRSDEELINDLKGRIKELKDRQESRRLKESASIRSALTAVRHIDKSLDLAADENNSHLRHALADARKPLEEYLLSEGLKLPKARKPRGRRPSK
ncbi:MAG: hypothetical protein ACI8QZ_002188 [Chlamydiales bacterium]|jgi:hypothetical protein